MVAINLATQGAMALKEDPEIFRFQHQKGKMMSVTSYQLALAGTSHV